MVIISDGHVKSAWKYIVFFAFSVAVETIISILDIHFLVNLILFIVAIIRKFLPCIIVGKWLLNSTSSSLAVATLQRMRVPKDALIMISVIFRCFPTIKDEWSHINMAMKTRGIGFSIDNLVHRPTATIEYFFVPLFVSVIEIGDELSQSAIVRGLDAPAIKTSRHVIKLKMGDYIILISLSVVICLVVLMRLWGYQL
jgi:energy-coupling factor transport system permease protein